MHILDGCSPLPLPLEVCDSASTALRQIWARNPLTRFHNMFTACHCHCISHTLSGPPQIFKFLLEECLAVHRLLTRMTLSLGYCRLEGEARGIYSGSLGFISFNGAFDLNIVIRTAILGKDTIRIGAGVCHCCAI